MTNLITSAAINRRQTTTASQGHPTRQQPSRVSNVAASPDKLHGMSRDELQADSTDRLLDMLESWNSERTAAQKVRLLCGLGSLFMDPTMKAQLRLFLHLTTRPLTEDQRNRLEHAIRHLPQHHVASRLDLSICCQQNNLFNALRAELSQLQPSGIPTLQQRLQQCRAAIQTLPETLPRAHNRHFERNYSPRVARHMAALTTRLDNIETFASALSNAPAASQATALQTFKGKIDVVGQ